jgi:excisionase family DNA binding protein
MQEARETCFKGQRIGRGDVEELISSKELSRMLKVSKPWPYVMVKRGLLPCYKMGKVIRFKWSDIEAFLEQSRVERR